MYSTLDALPWVPALLALLLLATSALLAVIVRYWHQAGVAEAGDEGPVHVVDAAPAVPRALAYNVRDIGSPQRTRKAWRDERSHLSG